MTCVVRLQETSSVHVTHLYLVPKEVIIHVNNLGGSPAVGVSTHISDAGILIAGGLPIQKNPLLHTAASAVTVNDRTMALEKPTFIFSQFQTSVCSHCLYPKPKMDHI